MCRHRFSFSFLPSVYWNAYCTFKLQILFSATPLELSRKASISSLIPFLTSSTRLMSVFRVTADKLGCWSSWLGRSKVSGGHVGRISRRKGVATRRNCGGSAWPDGGAQVHRGPTHSKGEGLGRDSGRTDIMHSGFRRQASWPLP